MPSKVVQEDTSELELPDSDGAAGDDEEGQPEVDELPVAEVEEGFDDSTAEDISDGTELLHFVEESAWLQGAEADLDVLGEGAGFALMKEEDNLLVDADQPGIEAEELDIEESSLGDDAGDEGPVTDDAQLDAREEPLGTSADERGEEGDDLESLYLFSRMPRPRQREPWESHRVLGAESAVRDLALGSEGVWVASAELVHVAGASGVVTEHGGGCAQVRVGQGIDAEYVCVLRDDGSVWANPSGAWQRLDGGPRALALGGALRVLCLGEGGVLFGLDVASDPRLKPLREGIDRLGTDARMEASVFVSVDPTGQFLHVDQDVRRIEALPRETVGLEVHGNRAIAVHDGALLELVGSSWESYVIEDEPIRGACFGPDGDVVLVAAAGEVLSVLLRSDGELTQIGQLPAVKGPVTLRWSAETGTLWVGGAFGLLRLERPEDA